MVCGLDHSGSQPFIYMCHTTWVHYHNIIRADILLLIIVHILEHFIHNVLLVSVLPFPGMMLADAITSVP